jgi:hypothetical protein
MTVSFGKIDRIALFGGSWLMGALLRSLSGRSFQVKLFAAARHLDDAVEADGATLRAIAEAAGIPYCSTDDINTEPELAEFVTPRALGLALGAAWVFESETAARFSGKLLDFMGIALPRYRGGAHYTWQILAGNRQGSCNLQVIHGGLETFHKGEIIRREDYFFPASARIPQDYFDAAVPRELAFLEAFFDELAREAEFPVQSLQESASSYFPFLYTRRHGLIDWSWSASEIERFVCAFDRPYPGASTFLSGRRLHLRGCHAEPTEGYFHPFQAGLVYRKSPGCVYVAARDGALVIESVTDEAGADCLDALRLGERLHTPRAALEEAMTFNAEYTAAGLSSG